MDFVLITFIVFSLILFAGYIAYKLIPNKFYNWIANKLF